MIDAPPVASAVEKPFWIITHYSKETMYPGYVAVRCFNKHNNKHHVWHLPEATLLDDTMSPKSEAIEVEKVIDLWNLTPPEPV